MTHIPPMVRQVLAAEQHCSFAHFYASFCDLSASPEVIKTAAFADTTHGEATPNHNDTNATSAAAAAANALTGGIHANTTGQSPAYQLVYDVMRSRSGHILFKRAYAERFVHSLSLAAPAYSFPAELLSTLQERLQRYIDSPGVYPDGTTEQNIKILSWLPYAAAGASPLPVLFYLSTSSYPPETMYQEGAKLGFLYDAHRENPNAKVVQADLRTRANAYEKENDIYEVLLVHSAAGGFLVPEGSRSSYLLERHDGSFWCSDEEDILLGITLTTTYRVVEACGRGKVQHAKLTLKDVLLCKSLYMLGTSPTIMPIQSVLLYTDAATKASFECALRGLQADLSDPQCNNVRYADDGQRAELLIPIDAAAAAQLRAQYFSEASAS